MGKTKEVESQKVVEEFFEKQRKINLKNILEERKKFIEQLKSTEYYQTDQEKKLYKQFCAIANADPDGKFKFEHIKALGIGADIVVIYGKKGIGKTYQISKIIRKLAEEDPKAEVILLRNTVAEFKALANQLTVDYCPIYMGAKEGGNPKLFHKELMDGNGKPRYMGFCASLNGFSMESAKGSEYPNIRLIIWDECTNVGKGNAGYGEEELDRFVTFFDSIIRNKGTNVKIYIFGNFHRRSDGLVADVLLDYLLIPYGCTLKIKTNISYDGSSKSKLLFINTRNLYKGIDSNSKIGLFGSKRLQKDLYDNMPQSTSQKVGSMAVFHNLEPKWGLFFSEGEEIFILLLSEFKQKLNDYQTEINWMIHMEPFPCNNVFTHTLYTTEAVLKSRFSDMDLILTYHQKYRRLIRDIFLMGKDDSLYFSNDVSANLLTKQMKLWQEEYNLGISASFFKSERLKKEGF